MTEVVVAVAVGGIFGLLVGWRESKDKELPEFGGFAVIWVPLCWGAYAVAETVNGSRTTSGVVFVALCGLSAVGLANWVGFAFGSVWRRYFGGERPSAGGRMRQATPQNEEGINHDE